MKRGEFSHRLKDQDANLFPAVSEELSSPGSEQNVCNECVKYVKTYETSFPKVTSYTELKLSEKPVLR